MPGSDRTANLERRLRRLESQSDLSQGGDRFERAASDFRTGGQPPPVSGLSVDRAALGKIAISWNAVAIGDLRRYDVQTADNANFTNATTTPTSDTFFTVQNPTAGESLFVRVRAVNQAGNAGRFSGVLDALTGNVSTDDIDDGAVTTPKIADTAVNDFGSSDVEGLLVIFVGGNFFFNSLNLFATGGPIFINFTVEHVGGGTIGIRVQRVNAGVITNITPPLTPTVVGAGGRVEINVFDSVPTTQGSGEIITYRWRFVATASDGTVDSTIFASGPKK